MSAPAQDPAKAPAAKPRDPRTGLRNSATLATVFAIVGHTVLGFEQSLAQMFVALISGYSCALLFEWVDARANHRPAGYAGGGFKKVVDFLLSAHMTSITLSFLLFANRRLWIMALATALAIGSKYIFRVYCDGRLRHFMNPSNFALAVLFFVFQWTTVLPWAFTTKIHGTWDWVLPAIIVCLGMRLNILFTRKLPLIFSWLGTFIVLGAVRAWFLQGTGVAAELVPLTGIPFVLFTFYMITDPQTSPSKPASQVLYGAGIAFAYSVFLILHVQYTMFYSVTVVAALRGLWMYAAGLRELAAARAMPPVAAVHT
ncbi:MAG TPA: RnfABCDGE type electron transport complex subunit D [Thermoanaerobaculia bacterium]|nr:RnfABCDGE type electron transport complex subunit D [Thermoanaerobaculia bacterium]